MPCATFTSKMKILKIVNSQDSGGVFAAETQYIGILKEIGHQVDLVIVGNGDKINIYGELADHYIQMPPLEVSYNGSISNIINSINKSKKHSSHCVNVKLPHQEYDAIVYRWPIYIQIAGVFSKRRHIRSFWHMPNTVNRILGRLYYTYYLHKYRITPIANSHFTARSLGKICKDVVYPGFDESKIKDSELNYREELNMPDDAVVFGVAARLNFNKAQDLVITAFIELISEYPNTHLIVAGGPLNSEFGLYCQELAKNYRKNIHFLGYIHTGGKYYNTINYFINSRRNEEPFGISIAEGLGAGKPGIAYYLGGPSEIIKEGINGWLLKVPDTSSYKFAMQKAMNNIVHYDTLSKNALDSSKYLSALYNVNKLLSIIHSNKFQDQ